MGGFFNGWRRKTGCVTLVMALVFTGGWVKSFTREDEIAITVFQRRQCFDSMSGLINWWAWDDPSPCERCEWLSSTDHCNNDLTQKSSRDFGRQEKKLIAEFRFDSESISSQVYLNVDGDVELNDDESIAASLRKSIIPYWYIVLPLTAISAWLLLTKRSNPILKPPEPTVAIGT